MGCGLFELLVCLLLGVVLNRKIRLRLEVWVSVLLFRCLSLSIISLFFGMWLCVVLNLVMVVWFSILIVVLVMCDSFLEISSGLVLFLISWMLSVKCFLFILCCIWLSMCW